MSEELSQPEYCPHCDGVVGIDCDDVNACAARHITPPPGYVMVPEEKFTAAEKLLSAGMSGAISAETAMLGIQDVLTAARAGEE